MRNQIRYHAETVQTDPIRHEYSVLVIEKFGTVGQIEQRIMQELQPIDDTEYRTRMLIDVKGETTRVKFLIFNSFSGKSPDNINWNGSGGIYEGGLVEKDERLKRHNGEESLKERVESLLANGRFP